MTAITESASSESFRKWFSLRRREERFISGSLGTAFESRKESLSACSLPGHVSSGDEMAAAESGVPVVSIGGGGHRVAPKALAPSRGLGARREVPLADPAWQEQLVREAEQWARLSKAADLVVDTA